MKTTIQESVRELISRYEYPDVIKAALQLIIDGQMNSLALDKVLARSHVPHYGFGEDYTQVRTSSHITANIGV